MSGETDAIIGVIVAPIVVAGMVLYGATRAIGWIAGQAYGAYKAHENKKQIQVNNMSADTAKLFEEFQKSFAEDEALLGQSIQAMQITLKKNADAMNQKLNSMDFTEDYAKKCADTVNTTLTKMEAISSERILHAETEGKKKFTSQVQKLKAARLDTQKMLDSLKHDKAAYEAKIKNLAGTALQDVKAVYGQLKDDGSGNLALWETEYKKAQNNYENGNYSAAYSNATALLDKIAEVLIDQNAKAQSDRVRRVNLLVQANAELARLQALTECKIQYEGRTVYEDLTRFYPKTYRAIAEILSKAVNQLDSDADLDRGELLKIKQSIRDAAEDLEELSRDSLLRMQAAYRANDAAKELKKKLAGQGFTFDGYAYEGNLEGRTMHVNFKNKLTGETVTVVLDPCSDTKKVGMKVKQYGDGKSGITDPVRQQMLEDLITGAVSATDVKCHAPGKNSVDLEAKDLDKLKKKTVND